MNLKQNLFDVAAFLSHQAAEKALKALYILKFKRLWNKLQQKNG
ncbi:MAG: HEPN domain-containing protein [Candidatus Aenigmarchaeota archaeon]|nr:HEPN domain-containing protein [Candidatus Aenigmarchaeota archaeon]